MSESIVMHETSHETTREDELLALFGDLALNLQEMVLRHMYTLERTERYRARRFGFRFEGFVRGATERELYHAIERWWMVRNNVLFSGQHLAAHLQPIEQCLVTCLRAIADQVLMLDGADELNLSAADWRHSVVDSLRMNERLRAGGEADDWLDQIRVVTADGRHHVAVRTARRLRDADHDYGSDDDEDDEDDEHAHRRVLRVWYSGPQRLRTYDTLDVPACAGGRLALAFPL